MIIYGCILIEYTNYVHADIGFVKQAGVYGDVQQIENYPPYICAAESCMIIAVGQHVECYITGNTESAKQLGEAIKIYGYYKGFLHPNGVTGDQPVCENKLNDWRFPFAIVIISMSAALFLCTACLFFQSVASAVEKVAR
jgi:hypothetical protein